MTELLFIFCYRTIHSHFCHIIVQQDTFLIIVASFFIALYQRHLENVSFMNAYYSVWKRS